MALTDRLVGGLRKGSPLLAQSVAFIFRLMGMADENPFQPRHEGPPLALTVDGRSLAPLTGQQRREAGFLLMLTHTPILDALLLDAPDDLADHLPRGEVAPPHPERDDRVIRQVGTKHGFYGGVRPWSSRERRADELGLSGEDREWFLYYETATWFHRNSKRHFYVTADDRLLEELKNAAHGDWWGGRRIATVRGALELVGWLMRTRDDIYLDARPAYMRHSSNYDFYFYVAHELAPHRVRLHRWLETHEATRQARDLQDLEQSIHARSVDLLKARDGVGFQWLRHQNNATLDEILYHLRAAVPAAAALFDSIALFAQLALGVSAQAVGGQSRVSFRTDKFRKELRDNGAERLAERAARHGPLWAMLGALRNPVVHGRGLSGIGYQAVPGPNESRLTLRVDQGEAVSQAAQSLGQSTRAWGLEESAGEPLLEPLIFAHRFTTAVLRAADELVRTLADELGAPDLEHDAPADEHDMLWKLGLLGGLAEELTDAGSPGWAPLKEPRPNG